MDQPARLFFPLPGAMEKGDDHAAIARRLSTEGLNAAEYVVENAKAAVGQAAESLLGHIPGTAQHEVHEFSKTLEGSGGPAAHAADGAFVSCEASARLLLVAASRM